MLGCKHALPGCHSNISPKAVSSPRQHYRRNTFTTRVPQRQCEVRDALQVQTYRSNDLSEHPAGTTLYTVWVFKDGTCTSSKPRFFKTADSTPLQNPTPFQSSLSLVHRVARHSTMNTSFTKNDPNRDHATVEFTRIVPAGGGNISATQEEFSGCVNSSTLLGRHQHCITIGPMHASTTQVSGVRQVRILLYPKPRHDKGKKA